MYKIKEEYEDFATCLCMITGAACSFVGFLNILGVMMAVMTISLELQLHLFKALRVATNGKLTKIKIQTLLDGYYNYQSYLGNSLQSWKIPNLLLSF